MGSKVTNRYTFPKEARSEAWQAIRNEQPCGW